jgi:hypothetical protein
VNRRTRRIGGEKKEMANPYPAYFLMRGPEANLAISTMDSISQREKCFSSGMSHLRTNRKLRDMLIQGTGVVGCPSMAN